MTTASDCRLPTGDSCDSSSCPKSFVLPAWTANAWAIIIYELFTLCSARRFFCPALVMAKTKLVGLAWHTLAGHRIAVRVRAIGISMASTGLAWSSLLRSLLQLQLQLQLSLSSTVSVQFAPLDLGYCVPPNDRGA